MHNFPFAFSMMQLIDTLSLTHFTTDVHDYKEISVMGLCRKILFSDPLFCHNITPEDSLWVYRKKFALQILIFHDMSI